MQEVTDAAAVREVLGDGWTIHTTAELWEGGAQNSQNLAVAWRQGHFRTEPRVEVIGEISRSTEGRRIRPGLAMYLPIFGHPSSQWCVPDQWRPSTRQRKPGRRSAPDQPHSPGQRNTTGRRHAPGQQYGHDRRHPPDTGHPERPSEGRLPQRPHGPHTQSPARAAVAAPERL